MSNYHFLVLGFVIVAVLLFPINDAFAFSITLFDDETYTISGYEDDRLYYWTKAADGVSQSTGTLRSGDGWMSPSPLPDSNVPGSYTWTWFSDNARTNQIAQVSWVRDIIQVSITTLEPESKYGRDGYHLSGTSNVSPDPNYGYGYLPYSICQEPPCDSSINGHYNDAINTDTNGNFDAYRDASFPLIGTWYVTVGSDTETLVFQSSSADTTPPVITVPSNQIISATNSTGSMYYIHINGDWPSVPTLSDITATDDVGFALASDVDNGAEQYTTIDFVSNKMSCVRSDGIVLDYSWYRQYDGDANNNWYHYPVGTTTITCTATDAAGNVGTGNFTVTVNYDSSADTPLITPTITTSAYLNSTSSTGRTLTANMGDWRDELTANIGDSSWQVLYAITDPNGESPDVPGQTNWSSNFWYNGWDSHYQNRWSIEIPSSWEPGVYTITSSVHSFATWNTDPEVVSPYSTTVTIPALDSTDTSISQGASGGTVSVDSLSIGQHGTKNGGDCDSVGTWVPSTGAIGGTCTLSKDIQITGNGIGVRIASSGVTLDGAGHTITGTQTAGYDHVGISTLNQGGTMAIKDLKITKFAYGIRSNYAVGLTITGVTVTDVGKTAMSFSGSSRLIVEGNTIDVNIPNSWYGGMIVGVGQSGNTPTGSCTATDAMYDGSYQWGYQEDLILIKNNVITGAAIATQDGVGYCIDGNTINNNPGIHISYPNDQVSPTNHMIKNNVITGGGGFKIIGSGNTFDSNTVTGGSVGFHNSGTANIFTNNIANNNSQHGFKFEPDTTPVTFTDNVATGNGVSDIEGYAVAVDDPLSNVDLLFDTNYGGVSMEPQPAGTADFYFGSVYGARLDGSVDTIGAGLAEDVDVNVTVLDPSGSVFSNTLALNGANIGEGHSFGLSWYSPDYTTLGTYTYTLTIDPDNKVNETNENNNVFTGSFEVVEEIQFPVDLLFDTNYGGVSMEPQPAGTADFYFGSVYGARLDGSVDTIGAGLAEDVDVNVTVLDPSGSVFSNTLALNGANIGEGHSFGLSWYSPDYTTLGTYTYTLTIDPDNKVNETNENNNVFTGSFEVVEEIQFPVDLLFDTNYGGVSMEPQPAGTADFYFGSVYGARLDGSVDTIGAGLAEDVDVNVTVLDPSGSVFSNTLALNGANIGEGHSFGLSWYSPDYTTLGTYTYTLTIDPDNKVNETNENNNVFTGSFEVVEIKSTCFTAAGYSVPWTSDPDTSSRDVQISGKLTPKQNGECLSSDAFSLEGQSVLVTATKNGVIKTATGTTFNVGLFNSIITFDDDSDEGTWDVTFIFTGQGEYLPTTEFQNGMESFTIVIPAPPPNPIPIVNTPNDITLYTGTPSFSFAQSTINYNLYSGNSGPVFYPQPTASITDVSSEVVTFDVTATDNDLSSGPTCDVTSGSEFSVGTTTVTCTATDFDGGVGTASFDVTVIEKTISGSPTCTPGSNSQFPIGSTPVSCSVNDGQGNASTDTFSVNVQPKSSLSDSQCRAAAGSGTNFGSRDETGSVFVCEYPFHVTVEEGQRLVWVDTQPWQGFYRHSVISSDWLNQAAGAPLFGFNSDSGDNIGVAVTPSSWGGIGTYQFYDGQNPTLTGSITIAESDTTAPNVKVPNDLVISTEDENGTPVVTYSISATDDREVVSGPTCDVQSGSTFSIGTTEVTCTASDAAGNTGTDSFDVTVEYTYIDTTPPGFAAYDDISKATTNPAGTVVSYTLPTVTDNIGVTSGPTCDLPSGSVFPIGTTEVKCDASDAAGNPASILLNVVMTKTYVDNTAPAVYITFGETSDEITIPADSSSGKELGFTVNAIDNVGVTVGPICSDAGASLGLTPIGGQPGFYTIGSKCTQLVTVFVVCTASDAAGNSGSSIFAVTIQPEVADTTPSIISTPMSITGLDFPMSVDVDDFGNIYVADVGSDTVKKYDSSHNLILTIEIPYMDPFDVAVDSNQNIWVAGPNKGSSGGSIVGYNSVGEQRSRMSAGFSVPIHSLSLNDDGKIYATLNPYSSSSEILLITTDRGYAHPDAFFSVNPLMELMVLP